MHSLDLAEDRAAGQAASCQALTGALTEDSTRTGASIGAMDHSLAVAATSLTRFQAHGLEREHTLATPPRIPYQLPTMVPATKPYADILAEFGRDWQEESTFGCGVLRWETYVCGGGELNKR
jgi:hypothetical protein